MQTYYDIIYIYLYIIYNIYLYIIYNIYVISYKCIHLLPMLFHIVFSIYQDQQSDEPCYRGQTVEKRSCTWSEICWLSWHQLGHSSILAKQRKCDLSITSRYQVPDLQTFAMLYGCVSPLSPKRYWVVQDQLESLRSFKKLTGQFRIKCWQWRICCQVEGQYSSTSLLLSTSDS